MRSRESFNTYGSRIVGERQNSLGNPLTILLPGNCLEFFGSRLLDKNLIACHCA